MLCLTKNKSKKISVLEARKENLVLTLCKQCLFVVNYLLHFLSLSIYTLNTERFAGGTHKKYEIKYICKDIWSSGLVLTVINLLQMNTYSSWLGQKGNRLVHSAKYKKIWTFSCLRQQMFFCSIRRRRRPQRRQRERQKSNRFILAKQQLFTCFKHVHHAFPSLHDCDVEMPNFTFCRGREHKTSFFFFSWTLMQSLEFNFRKKQPTFDELNELE